MTETGSSINVATAREVAAALTSLNLSLPNRDALLAISRVCRDEFLSNLSACMAGQDADGVKRKSLESLLSCLTPETYCTLRALGFVPTYDVIVQVARKTPTRFLSALTAATNAGHLQHGVAKAYLGKVLASAPSVVFSAPSASAPHPQSVAAPATSGAYRSHPVYGSGYALRFNPDIREGKPGIMVEAAVSSGTKTYDWKDAIDIWLRTQEIAAVLAVFRKRCKAVNIACHETKNKSFSLGSQGGHFFCKVGAKKAAVHPTRAVKILPQDAYCVSILFVEQLLLAYPNLPRAEVLTLA